MSNVNVGGIIKEVVSLSHVGEELKLRLRICDETGEVYVALPIKDFNEVEVYKPGKYLYVMSGVVKENCDRELEVRLGKSGKVHVKEALEEARQLLRGIVVRSYDPIRYGRGKVSSAMLRDHEGRLLRLLLWGIDLELEVGDVVEVYDIDVRVKPSEITEVHVNDLRAIRVVAHEKAQPLIKKVRLNQIKGDERDIAVEGEVEEVFRGDVYSKIMLRDQKVVLPVIFWEDKAEIVEKIRKGCRVAIEGCRVKHSRNGLELYVMRWSKVRVL